jgi:hypothetical protein
VLDSASRRDRLECVSRNSNRLGCRRGETTRECRASQKSAAVKLQEAPMKVRLPITIICVLALLLSTSTPALASADSDLTTTVVDAAVARPFTFALTAVGSALFVVTLPFTAPSGSMNKAAKTLVVSPAKDTFKRPLGDMGTFLDY